MMLWDIIRDFFVQYVFGGMTSDFRSFAGYVGNVTSIENGDVSLTTDTLALPMGGFEAMNSELFGYIYLGDWLSTTATIFVLVLLCVCAGLFVRWMFKWIGGCLSRLGR